jgi:cell division protein FtsL
MATDKRERQRANRETKKAAEAKKKRRSDAFALVRKWALYGLLIIVVFVIANLLLG